MYHETKVVAKMYYKELRYIVCAIFPFPHFQISKSRAQNACDHHWGYVVCRWMMLFTPAHAAVSCVTLVTVYCIKFSI